MKESINYFMEQTPAKELGFRCERFYKFRLGGRKIFMSELVMTPNERRHITEAGAWGPLGTGYTKPKPRPEVSNA